jgi:hypothetical protein
LLGSLEDSILIDHWKCILPLAAPDNRLKVFDNILRYEMPWAAEAGAPQKELDGLEALYNRFMEEKKNG